ncbi:MAG: ABC transporter ATP-binding protein [Blautia sp.]|nr:ABC transporter ATP-binding protein [Blautia sp.]
MAETYFRTENLSVGYDRKALIHDICLDIKKGEIVALIGPNGSGKSTILKSITRQLSLIAGCVYIDGSELRHLGYRALSQKMAVVLTERIRPELMTCHEIVATGRYPYTGHLGILSEEDEQKVETAMRSVHAEDLGSRDFNAISDGQRQRVLLARAICQEPEIIILDEPTSFLDIRHKLDLLSILRTMAMEKDITVILSLHEIDLAQKLADRIICVKGDVISSFGRPEEIFKENTVQELYGLEAGAYDALFGSVELPPPEGEPRTFVISGAGTGIPVFRRLQKEKVPFIAGILYSNDIDYRIARLLAAEVIEEEPFGPVSDQAFTRATQTIEKAERVIATYFPIKEQNHRMAELIETARAAGKLEMV